MVALVDRYIFSLIARARVRGLSAEWVENLFGFALVPDLVVYLDIDIEHLVPRVLSTTGFDYWESGQDYLPSPDVYNNFVEHQTRLLAEFRRLATEHAFTTRRRARADPRSVPGAVRRDRAGRPGHDGAGGAAPGSAPDQL